MIEPQTLPAVVDGAAVVVDDEDSVMTGQPLAEVATGQPDAETDTVVGIEHPLLELVEEVA